MLNTIDGRAYLACCVEMESEIKECSDQLVIPAYGEINGKCLVYLLSVASTLPLEGLFSNSEA